MSDQNSPTSLPEVVEKPVKETEGETITLGDILDSYGSRSYGPLLVIISIIAAIPIIGGIPGMSIITGLLVIVLSSQLLLGKQHPWLPKKPLSVTFKRKKLTKGVDKAKPWANWFGKVVGQRLTFMVAPPFQQLIALVCIILGILFVPTALLPFAVCAPAAGVFLFGLALTTRDGVMAIIALVVSLIAFGLTVYLMPWIIDAAREALQWIGLA